MDEVIRPVTDADIVDLSHYLARLALRADFSLLAFGLEEFSQGARPHSLPTQSALRAPVAARIRAMTICPGQTRDTFVWLCDDRDPKTVNNSGRTS